VLTVDDPIAVGSAWRLFDASLFCTAATFTLRIDRAAALDS